MAKEWAKKFYNSIEWQKCRDSYIKSLALVNGSTCERCGREGYIVHHKKWLNPNNINDPDVTLNFNNLEYLCRECHNKEHDCCSKKNVTREDVVFNEFGELVSVKGKG